jgi:eukaryotic-like serine/threonine-protein kinase
MPIGDFGPFELIEELGRGDMGIVYKARDPSQDRLVALKVLQAGARATGDDLQRFLREARVTAWVQHPHIVPNIVPIYAFGQDHEGLYLVRELIDGPSLDRKLGGFADGKAPARLVKTLADAVHHAHRRGFLHLDLNPHNVVLDETGEPHLIDFGRARRIRADGETTRSRAILGAPDYTAPEQASGRGGTVTAATDVYGLGAILYALFTGRAPFGADSPAEALAQVRSATLEPPSRRHPWISRDLESIVLKCLEKEPQRRYSTAAALADDLGRHLNGEPIRDLRAG